jgi:RNA polymerase sigma-70 factor (ECF subfamily)
METDERKIIRRVNEGDLDAFGELVDRYKKKIYYIAYHMTCNHSDADDIAQETFIRAYRNIAGFKGKSSFYTWLYRILINRCTDYMKRKRRRDHRLNEIRDPANYLGETSGGGSSPGSFAGITIGELQRAVAGALMSLPEKQRMALVLHEFNGLSHKEIADVVGCSEGTVRSRLHYGRRKMKEMLKRFNVK